MTESESQDSVSQSVPAPANATANATASLSRRIVVFLVAALIIVVDQLSKRYIEEWLPLNRTWMPFPEYSHLFRITHVSNTGAAFGLFPGGSFIFTGIALIVALVILVYNYRLPGSYLVLRLALGMQLGGALGNLIDRLRLGHVTDFLDFGPWPVFNVADMAIVGGVILLGILMLFEEPAAPPEPQAPQAEKEYDRPPSGNSISQFTSQQNHEQTT